MQKPSFTYLFESYCERLGTSRKDTQLLEQIRELETVE